MPGRFQVLLLTEEGPFQEKLLGMIENIGAMAQAVPDCLTAMGVVKRREIDVVVIAEDRDGFDVGETARVLKSLQGDRYLAVVAVADEPHVRPATRETGLFAPELDEVLPPGFDQQTLARRLHAALRLKSVHDQLLQVRGELENALSRENALLKQLREDNRNLKVRSITDGLTALYNHRYLMEWLQTEFKISRRYGHPLAMMIIDLDHFKQINDRYGHPFGDAVLKEVAVILKECGRESDLVARYAGDEFALVCPRSGREDVKALGRRILGEVRRRTFRHKEQEVPLTLSIGTAVYPEDPEITSAELLVFLADQALYQAKRLGRNAMTSWNEVDPETRAAIRCELYGGGNRLLGNDPKSRVELDAAARLAGMAKGPKETDREA